MKKYGFCFRLSKRAADALRAYNKKAFCWGNACACAIGEWCLANNRGTVSKEEALLAMMSEIKTRRSRMKRLSELIDSGVLELVERDAYELLDFQKMK